MVVKATRDDAQPLSPGSRPAFGCSGSVRCGDSPGGETAIGWTEGREGSRPRAGAACGSKGQEGGWRAVGGGGGRRSMGREWGEGVKTEVGRARACRVLEAQVKVRSSSKRKGSKDVMPSDWDGGFTADNNFLCFGTQSPSTAIAVFRDFSGWNMLFFDLWRGCR